MGGDILGWLLNKVDSNQKKARSYCQKMLDAKIIANVNGRSVFGVNDTYQFYFDSINVADNLQRVWRHEVHDPNEIAANLVGIIQDLYEQAITPDQTGEIHTIDVEHALMSKEFSTYLTQVAEVEKVNLMNLSIP